MRLLITTQALDANDPVLGFFAGWVGEFSKHFDQVTVICLRTGAYDLPANVRVLALGGAGRLSRAYGLIKGAYKFRGKYDAVFVHMNQEYILAAGWLWKLLGKRIYMWRNHYAGSFLTDVAAAFCAKVFCTSRRSYTARYKKAVLMPVGIDTTVFKPQQLERKQNSILFLARMAPSKRADTLVGALKALAEGGINFSATLVGSPLPKDEGYYESLKRSAETLGERVAFLLGVPNAQTPALYSAHELFVNCSPSGMYDKTIFEAAACGCIPLASSEDWKEAAGESMYFAGAEELAEKLRKLMRGGGAHERDALTRVVKDHTLNALAARLSSHMSQ